MAIKRTPHHPLVKVQQKFSRQESLEITRTALESARSLGYTLKDVVEAVQALDRRNFVKSETAHSPPNSRIWHDTYKMFWDGRGLYLKFAGETLIDLVLTSFKETENV